MFILVRALTYATLFVGVLLVYLPSRLVAPSGLARPSLVGLPQVVGLAATTAGGALAIWCVLTFAFVGRGTPAPFDPPRRLVVGGPYRLVRNPMYLGAVAALTGAALVYRSAAIGLYAAGFLLATHVFVVAYEEPTLRATFGSEYDRYCERVRRWWPRPKRNSGNGGEA